jgi:hypothetical protein
MYCDFSDSPMHALAYKNWIIHILYNKIKPVRRGGGRRGFRSPSF